MSSLVWVELAAEIPNHNLQEIRDANNFQGLQCAIVKSNAYGHGVKEIVPLLTKADWLGVNSLDEGLEVRAIEPVKPILLLGYVPLSRLNEVRKANLRMVIYNQETLDFISEMEPSDQIFQLHIKVETGTWRQGILPKNVLSMAKKIREIPGAYLDGIYTHFANIEDTLNHSYAEKQLSIFNEVLENLKSNKLLPPVVHTACTAATILFAKTHFSMIRTGIGMYGLWPSRETRLSAESANSPLPKLMPVLTWKTKIVQIKEAPEGSFIGYGCSYKTSRVTKVAVLPVGYADGYRRSLADKAWVLVKGKRAQIIGRICMNLCMIDVTDIQGIHLEEDVVLLGESGDDVITAEMLADWMGTINYEAVTGISPLFPRVLKKEGV